MQKLIFAGICGLAAVASAQDSAKSLFVDATSGAAVQASADRTAGGSSGGGRRAGSAGTPVLPVSGSAARTASVSPVTGVMYWIELRTEKGQLLRVNADRQFKSGERIRLHVTSNVDGVLNIMQCQNDEPFSMLYPARAGADNRVQAFQEKVFPSADGFFRFDSRPGHIRLLLMVQASGQAAAPSEVQVATAHPAEPVPVAQPAPAPTPSSSSSSKPGARPAQTSPASNSTPAPKPAPLPSAKPASRPEPVQYARNTPPAPLPNEMLAEIEKLKGSKALVEESDNSPTEAATYTVVDTRKASDVRPGVVAIEVKLTHNSN